MARRTSRLFRATCEHEEHACSHGDFKCEDAKKPQVIHTDTAARLEQIKEPGRELVIWRRELPLCLRHWLNGLDAGALPDLRLLAHLSDFNDALTTELDHQRIACGAPRAMLVADIVQLAKTFHGLTAHTPREPIDVRIEALNHNACWKFHRDNVEARLLTTYRGSGTQWIDPAFSDRALEEQDTYSGPIENMVAGDVGIFRGRCAGDGAGIVHRSPPIAGTGETRLLLCLDRPSAVSPPLWRAA